MNIPNKDLITYLGRIGSNLPILFEHEWKLIFNFVEYFYSIEFDSNAPSYPNFNWAKVLEILTLLGKVK